MFRFAQHDNWSKTCRRLQGSCQLPLQKIHLCVLLYGLGETNADADQAHGFASSPECFSQE